MNIESILEQFDNLTNRNFDESDVSSALRNLLPEDRSNIDEQLKAEIMAFDFAEDYKDQKTGWGTYFGPMMVLYNEDGTGSESPSIKLITSEMIGYWEKRAYETKNPILKSRYSGLVWDFKNKITGTIPSHEICELYITAIIDKVNGDFHKHEINTYPQIKRALTLAIELNKEELVNQIKNALIAFEDRYSIDDKPVLWGYSFDWLIGNKRVSISSEEEQKIIFELESKLNRLTKEATEKQKIDPWAAEAAAERLANYYRKKQKSADVKRVILEVGKAYDKIIANALAMQASNWLDHLHKLYIEFNLNNEAESVLLKIRDLGPQVASELKPITTSVEVPSKDMEDYIALMTTGDIKEVIIRIASQFIPIKEKVKEQIFDLSRNYPLTFLFAQQLQDEKGRVVATIGSLEHDLEGHIISRVSQNLGLSAFFLRIGLQEAINKKGLGKSEILDFLDKTPIINKDRFQIIDRGLDAYFKNDYLVFIHLIIPQIEEAIRNIVELAGGNVLKRSRGGGFHLRTFDEILRDDIITNALGEDFTNYFRVLFTDQRGWNLRNYVCHGMASPNMFNSQSADRILHSLICLGLIHKKESGRV